MTRAAGWAAGEPPPLHQFGSDARALSPPPLFRALHNRRLSRALALPLPCLPPRPPRRGVPLPPPTLPRPHGALCPCAHTTAPCAAPSTDLRASSASSCMRGSRTSRGASSCAANSHRPTSPRHSTRPRRRCAHPPQPLHPHTPCSTRPSRRPYVVLYAIVPPSSPGTLPSSPEVPSPSTPPRPPSLPASSRDPHASAALR